MARGRSTLARGTGQRDGDTRAPERRARGTGSLGYIPALDGLRGAGLVFVFAFHVGYSWAAGALLALSVFFTLSGFLITRLILDEVGRTGRLNLPGFWSRRLRRLLPAAILGILFVLLLSATVLPVDPDKLRGDAFAALGYVANWRFILESRGYLEQFATPSPLLHYWSLSLEEQFYLLFPLLVAGVLWITSSVRRFRVNLRIVLLVLIVFSLGTSFFARATDDFDLFYYGLPTRGGEILVGALLATSLIAARVVRVPARWWTNAIGVVSLTGIAALMATTTFDSSWIRDGGLTVFAILSCGLIFSVLPTGPIGHFFALWPLRWLGKISYGFYIFHWPVILWLTPERTGLTNSMAILLQVAVTLAMAITSYFLIEQPIRRGDMITGAFARIAAPIGAVVLIAVTFTVTGTFTLEPELDLASAKSELEKTTQRAVPDDSAADALPTVAFYGDSTGLMAALGVADWSIEKGHLHVIPGVVDLGCTLIRQGTMRYQGRVSFSQQDCESGVWSTSWPPNLAKMRPDIAVIMFGPGDVADRMFPGDSEWRAPGDPLYDEYLKREMLAAADVTLSRGYPTVWLTNPISDAGRGTVPPSYDPTSDPARVKRFNEILREVAGERPELHLIDYAKWMERRPGGSLDPTLRPDGVHLARNAAATVLAPWLGPAILRAAGWPESSDRNDAA
jgi:peptidoglycan/LPS O-acetylase OafA/YrhL